METMDLSNWHFLFEWDPRFLGTCLEEPSEKLPFATAVDLLKFLAKDAEKQSAFKKRIRDHLRSDPAIAPKSGVAQK